MTKAEMIYECRKFNILKTYEMCGFNKQFTADTLGVHQNSISYHLNVYEERGEFKDPVRGQGTTHRPKYGLELWKQSRGIA